MWEKIYDFFDTLWGYPMLILLVGGGLYYGIRTGFFQIRCLPLIFRKTFGEMFRKQKDGDRLEGTLTPFQALSMLKEYVAVCKSERQQRREARLKK